MNLAILKKSGLHLTPQVMIILVYNYDVLILFVFVIVNGNPFGTSKTASCVLNYTHLGGKVAKFISMILSTFGDDMKQAPS